ncbi:MAG: prepilin peptidase [Chloroflexi bacterium]|nr:prepilin peptidase [Chloroflexota bacterium]
MTTIIAAILGLAWGFVSDRIAARWPAHEGGSVRGVDWRTPLVVLLGGAAFWGTAARFEGNPAQLAFVGVYVVALVLLFATDLDQKLLPDVITLPLVVLALAAFATGAGPYVHTVDDLAWATAAAIGVPVGLYLLAIPFGAGAIGQGDLKLLVSVGLLAGALKLFYGLVAGALLAGIVVAVLVVTRRLSMKSFVPYGPFLIAGALWSMVALPS